MCVCVYTHTRIYFILCHYGSLRYAGLCALVLNDSEWQCFVNYVLGVHILCALSAYSLVSNLAAFHVPASSRFCSSLSSVFYLLHSTVV